jgi:hypothetical protein
MAMLPPICSETTGLGRLESIEEVVGTGSLIVRRASR